MKVMLSLPEETVAVLDDLAAEAGSTRSALVASLADKEVIERRKRRVAKMHELMATRPRGSYGGDAGELIREDRHSH